MLDGAQLAQGLVKHQTLRVANTWEHLERWLGLLEICGAIGIISSECQASED